MQPNKLSKIVPNIAVVVLAMLIAGGNFYIANPSCVAFAAERFPPALDEETGPAHLPLATMGITLGQTARINVVNSKQGSAGH
jgi:hypothetical protein